MRALIAEDDLTSRLLLTTVLKRFGHEVLESVNGKEAWAAMQQPDAPKLAILDWMMPRLDGIEVCRRIRTIETDLPPYIIMLTAKTDKDDIIAGLEAGADDYLTKPFHPGELKARVDVGRRMLETQNELHNKIVELREASDQIKVLQGILPICSFCKKIRDDKGYWDRLESYFGKHSEARFSHGVCPDCMKTHYPEVIVPSNTREIS